jgi:DNA mismatch repair protein MutS
VSLVSILFHDRSGRIAEEQLSLPALLRDLNLDQVVAAIAASKQEYNLSAFFRAPLHDADAVAFRQEVIRDLEDTQLFNDIKDFARKMQDVRRHLAQKDNCHYQRQKERWFLDAVETYCDAVDGLLQGLSAGKSRGIAAFRDYLAQYAASERFLSLAQETRRLKAALASIRYLVLIQGGRVEVRHYEGEPDYGAEVEAAFAGFQQDTVQGYNFGSGGGLEMNHVEARILDGVATLHPDTFGRIENFCTACADFQDPAVVAFDREIQFYVGYLEYIARLKQAGLNFCYPHVSASRKDVCAYQAFDLALAARLIDRQSVPVCNDFQLEGQERIIVVSGPNQGGKTTFARTFGQLHYLASLGLPIPGTRARIYLFDQIFTHFEREERMTSLRGRLEDDLVRMREILEAATPRSIVIINEIFSSTTLSDAVLLSRRIASALIELDLLCVWVTFIDELASLQKTVSMVGTVAPDNPAVRTFRIVRQPADGLAYAMSLAEKYRLTYSMLRERISDEGAFTLPGPGS